MEKTLMNESFTKVKLLQIGHGFKGEALRDKGL